MDAALVRRRVKAARALAAISVDELAERIGQRGLGTRTLRELEGEAGRPFRPMELREIAQACEVPYAFFTVDLNRLPEIAPADVEPTPADQDVVAQLLERVASLERRLGPDYSELDEASKGLEDLAPPGEPEPASTDTPAPAASPDEADQAPRRGTQSGE